MLAQFRKRIVALGDSLIHPHLKAVGFWSVAANVRGFQST
jgi:hypothetical protein